MLVRFAVAMLMLTTAVSALAMLLLGHSGTVGLIEAAFFGGISFLSWTLAAGRTT
jgi:hypothetical protein